MRRKRINLLNNNRGMALIIAMFALVFTIAIATEVAYQAHVEYVSAANSVNRLKAYYAAKAGVEISLFRILIYKKAVAQYKDVLEKMGGTSVLDPIWQFPFAWPPTALGATSEAAKSEIKEIMEASSFDGQYAAQISGEGGKIDINDLASPSEPLANAVRTQILEIFRRKLEDDEIFKDKYENFDFEELVNDIADWIDENDQSRASNGAETLRYEQPEGTNFKLPPNQGFKTTEELHMVKGMDDTLFDILASNITVFGTKGINVNQASAEIIKSLDPQITKEIAQATIGRRTDMAQGGPYRDDNDFFGFLEGKGVRTENLKKLKIPLLYDAEYNFRIVSLGQAVNSQREITAITYDIDGLTTRYVELLDEADKKEDQGGQGQGQGQGGQGQGQDGSGKKDDEKDTKKKVPMGRPTVVYWDEN